MKLLKSMVGTAVFTGYIFLAAGSFECAFITFGVSVFVLGGILLREKLTTDGENYAKDDTPTS